MINSSLEWQSKYSALELQIKKIKIGKKELIKIASNIDLMVIKLSNEEINCRRLQKQTDKHREILNNINSNIIQLEHLITFGLLL